MAATVSNGFMLFGTEFPETAKAHMGFVQAVGAEFAQGRGQRSDWRGCQPVESQNADGESWPWRSRLGRRHS
jgi:hypothetical protein